MPRRSAAGGESGAPRAQRGTRLKATTERAFLATPAQMPDVTEKACPSLPTVRNGSSLIRTTATIDVVPKARRSAGLEPHRMFTGRHRRHTGSGEQGRDDRTHPRVSQAPHQ